MKEDGTPYKVFTPYYRKGCLQNSPEPRIPLEVPKNIKFLKHEELRLEELELLPKKNWYKNFKDDWSPGENGAREKLNQFLQARFPMLVEKIILKNLAKFKEKSE